jgi:hypothetical protein
VAEESSLATYVTMAATSSTGEPFLNSRQHTKLAEKTDSWKLTSNIHSSHDLKRPEAKRFRVRLTNLNIPKIDHVEVFIDLLEAENLKSKNLTDEYSIRRAPPCTVSEPLIHSCPFDRRRGPWASFSLILFSTSRFNFIPSAKTPSRVVPSRRQG